MWGWVEPMSGTRDRVDTSQFALQMDSDWASYVGRFAEAWERCTAREELMRALDGDATLAQVAWGLAGPEAIAWLRQPHSALGGLSPVACLATESLRRRLREALMRGAMTPIA